ncbi:MAG: NUDIX hydrolase [Candidatus Aenigmarchaeota archaeon]|nr:NUDIX hydrolase [Candidatus Aenigmarchaeota archaeon]
MTGEYHNRTVDIYKVWELIEEMKPSDNISFEDLLNMSDYKCKEHTVDVVVELFVRGEFEGIVLVKRGREPFKGFWCLPGGHINYDEVDPSGNYLPTVYAAIRETCEETGLDVYGLMYLDHYNNWGRDTSQQRINTAFIGHSYVESVEDVVAGDDAVDVMVVRYEDVPCNLAFDHNEIIEYAQKVSRNSTPLSFLI